MIKKLEYLMKSLEMMSSAWVDKLYEKLYNFILFIYNDSKEKFWIIVIKGFLILDLSKPKQNSFQELSG